MTFFSVSLTKLSVMSVLTGGIYPLFWHFKNWQLISVRTGRGRYVQPLGQTLLAFFLCYPLFKRINRRAREVDARGFAALPLALAWIALTLVERLAGNAWMLSLMSFLPLLRVQRAVNEINEADHPASRLNSRFSAWNVLACAFGSAMLVFATIGAFVPELLKIANGSD